MGVLLLDVSVKMKIIDFFPARNYSGELRHGYFAILRKKWYFVSLI